MHFMPDTEDQDSAAEIFWPEGYKQVIREITSPFFKVALLKDSPFISVYESNYQRAFPTYSQFLDRLAEMLSISLENGADDGFDEIVDAFLKEAPLPPLRSYVHYHPLSFLDAEIKQKIAAVIIDEYSRDNIYVYAYGVGYQKTIPLFDDYIHRVAEIVIAGAQNTVNDTMDNIFRNLYLHAPLPPTRRHPRRLKMW